MPSDASPASQPRSSFQGVKRELEADDDTELHRPLKQMPALSTSSHSVDVQASEFIQVELNQSKDLLRNRRTILEAALEFVNRVSHQSNEATMVEEAMWVGYPSPLPPFAPETLVLLLRGESIDYFFKQPLTRLLEMSNRSASSDKTVFPDHILPKTLEKMGTALINNTVSGQTLIEYEACVHFKTFVLFSMWPPLEGDDPLKKHIKASRDRHRELMSRALNNISVMAQPTFGLCQALVCGVSTAPFYSSASSEEPGRISATQRRHFQELESDRLCLPCSGRPWLPQARNLGASSADRQGV